MAITSVPGLRTRPLSVRRFGRTAGGGCPRVCDIFRCCVGEKCAVCSRVKDFVPRLLLDNAVSILYVEPSEFIVLS